MLKPKTPKNLRISRKLIAVLLTGILFLSLQNIVLLEPASGGINEDADGNLFVTAGSQHEINLGGGTYQMQGNITVDGSGSRVLIRNTTLKFLKGDGFRYHFDIKNGGTLEIVNSVITVDNTAGGSEENIDVYLNTGNFEMFNSSLRFPGLFEAVSSSVLFNYSTVEHNPFSSLKSSAILNLTDSNVIVRDSTIDDIVSGEDIYLRGSTKFVAINAFLNLTSSHVLKLYGTAVAKLYSLNTQDKTYTGLVNVNSATASAEIYRLLTLTVKDSTNVPVGGAFVTPRNYSNQQMVPPPDAEILNYYGKSVSNYNRTDYRGRVLLPLLSDNITNSGVDYDGNYLLEATISTYSTNGGYSLKPYPNFYSNFNNPSFTLKFSSVIPPELNEHYSKALPPLKITANVVFTSPLQLQQNLIIDGGTLTVLNTRLEMNQTSTERYFVILKNGGKLILQNSEMTDPAGWPLNMYAESSSTITAHDGKLGLGTGILNLRGGSELDMNATAMTGSINSRGTGNRIELTEASTLSAGDIMLDDTEVYLKDTRVTTGTIATKNVKFTAVNTTFNKKLTFENAAVANLTNVTFPGVSGQTISILDTSEVNIFWWLTVRVVDGGDNLLDAAMVNVFNYTLGGQKVLYAQRETNSNGLALFDVYSEKRNASGIFKGIERNYFLNATYRKAISSGLGTLPLTSNKLMELEFDLAADLVLESHSIVGNLFAGNMLSINATVKNVGDFDLNTTSIPVRFFIDGVALGGDEVLLRLAVDESAVVSKAWTATMGTHIINISVDPSNAIGEKNESNNKATSIVSITVSGPNVGISASDIVFDPEVPNEKSSMNVSAKITNFGGYDPADNGDNVEVRFYVNDPALGGSQIGTTQVIASIPPTTSQTVSVNYTVPQVGNYNIFVVVSTKFDSNLNNNKANRTLVIFTLPDLYTSADEIKFIPSNKLIQEAPTFISTKIFNIGGTAVDNVGVAFYDGDPDSSGVRIGFNTSIAAIAPNGGTVTVQIEWTPMTLGTHKIFVVIDPDNLVIEAKKNNNVANSTVEVLSKPNLYIESVDITFSANPITEGDPLVIQALIHNEGDIAVRNVIVRVTLNSLSNPALVPDTEIPNIPANSMFNLPVTWTEAGPNGTQSIYIWIDPDNTIPESNKLDNHATKTLVITKTIDLRVSEDDILLDNLTGQDAIDFGKEVEISAKIYNDGGSPTKTDFIVQFLLSAEAGDSQLGDDITILSIDAGDFVLVSVKWMANTSGNQIVFVLVDPSGLVLDSNLANNKAFIEFRVRDPPDLAIEDDVITFSTGDYVKAGESITISTVIQNRGETDGSNINVKFYDGDPDDPVNGSVQIGKTVTILSIESLGRVLINITWQATSEGVHDIYVVIDPEEVVPDPDRENNVAFGTVEVLSFAPDLAIQDVSGPENALVGDVVSFSITLSNLGNMFATNVAIDVYESYFSGPQDLVFTLTFDNISASGLESQEYNWGGAGVAGEYELIFEVDPENQHKEFNERNNLWTKSINIQETAKADLKLDVIDDSNPDLNTPLYYEPAEPRDGETITFSINIRNVGTRDHNGAFNVTLEEAGSVQVRVEVTEAIPQGDSVIIKIQWQPPGEGTYKIRIVIDPENSIVESSKSNNDLGWTLEVLSKSGSGTGDTSSLFTLLLIIVVIIVILVALVYITLISQRRTSEWAECSECSSPMPLDATVCPECGAEFSDEMECGECHTLISVNDVKCPSCGATFIEEGGDKKKGLFGLGDDKGEEEEEEKVEEPAVVAKPVVAAEEEEAPKVLKVDDEKKKKDEDEKDEKDDEDEGADILVAKGKEMDEEEFQEFERALDDDEDDDLEDIDDDDDELEQKLKDDVDSELAGNGKSVNGEDKKPEPSVAADDDEKADKDKAESDKDKKKDTKAKSEKKSEDDEEKDDFVIPGDKWTAECYKCGARIPLSASICPECGANFE